MSQSHRTDNDVKEADAESVAQRPHQLMFSGFPEPWIDREGSHAEFNILKAFSNYRESGVYEAYRLLADGLTLTGFYKAVSNLRGQFVSSIMDVSVAQRRLDLIEKRQDLHEFYMQHAIRPALRSLSAESEFRTRVRDKLPASASAEYEWLNEVKPVIGSVEELLEEFEDLSTRLSLHMKLIKRLQDLLEAARETESRYLRSAVLTVYDASRSVYSEDLTAEQVKAIAEAVDSLYSLQWDVDKVQSLDSKLRDVGFETIPSDRFVIAN